MKTVLTATLALLVLTVQASALNIDFGPVGQPVAAGYESFEVTVNGTFPSISANLPVSGNLVTLTAQNLGGVGTPVLKARDDSSMSPALGDSYKKHLRAVLLKTDGGEYSMWTWQAGFNGELEYPAMKIDVAGLTPSTLYDVAIGSSQKWCSHTYLTLSGLGATAHGDMAWGGVSQQYAIDNLPIIAGQFATDAQGVLTVTLAYDQALTQTNGDDPAPIVPGNDPMVGLSLMTINEVPEPATLALLALGALGLLRRRQ